MTPAFSNGEHCEELPLKEMSTQNAYLQYAKNWILPRWGDLLLEEVKTVEVERWLRSAEMADGSKAKIKLRDVGAFLSRGALGIFYSQSDFFRNRRQTGAERWRSRQCQTPYVSLWCSLRNK